MTTMNAIPLRLLPGDDLRGSLERLVRDKGRNGGTQARVIADISL